MLDTVDGSKYSGKFAVDGKEIDGELTFSGADTHLLLHHPEFFRPDNIDDQCVFGTLRDLTRVSLLQCLAPSISGSSWSQHLGGYESATIRPHFILHGRRHLASTDELVKSIHFTLTDAPVIFPDYSSFSTALGAKPEHLRSALKEKQKLTGLRPRIGQYPIIAYFTGKYNIFKSKTILGEISAFHQPSSSFGGPGGIFIKNEIGTRITFPKLLTFSDSLSALITLLSFFEIITGRRQEIKSLNIELKGKDILLSTLQVYWCRPPSRMRQGERDPQPIDLPINAAREPKIFASLLANWLERHETWKDARGRFSASFCEENFFTPDRLIGSANMFDLLPSTAVPKSIILGKELREARDEGRKLFKALPESAERDSVLAALGRLGHASLKRKIQHRAGIVVAILGSELPGIFEVLDLAVDARNHFVHGTQSNIDYVGNFFETVAFFCRALEFVFIVSDLLEVGWDVRAWRKNGTTLSHPLASFLHSYPAHLQQLKDVLPPQHKLKTIK